MRLGYRKDFWDKYQIKAAVDINLRGNYRDADGNYYRSGFGLND